MTLFTNDWQVEWSSGPGSESDFSTTTSSDSTLGGSLLELAPSTTGVRAISNTVAGGIANPEVVGLIRAPNLDFNSQNGYCRLYVCGGGAADAENAYYVSMHTGNWRLVKYSNGNLNELARADPVSQNTWYWVRLRAENTGTDAYRIKAKFWAKGNSEPSAWDIDMSRTGETNIPSSGWVGVGGYPELVQQWDWIGFADSGNSVPIPGETPITVDSAAEWNAIQSEQYVHHEQPAATDWAAANTLEAGLASKDFNGNALELYFPLDDDSGPTVADVSGNGRDGTAVQSPSFGAPGLGGTSAVSLGPDDYIYFPDIPVFDSTTDHNFTVASWFNLDTWNFSGSMRIWDLSGQMNYTLRVDGSSEELTPVLYDGSTVYSSNHTIQKNTWYYAVLTNEQSGGSDTATFYLASPTDSKYSSLQSVASFTGIATDPDDPAEVNAIGAAASSPGGTPSQEFNGQVDEFQVYSRVRSQSELAAEYQSFL